MKLREIILKNFRGYYAETRITIDDLTALIGKNDVGKSTILEALDIFFNQSKIDSADRNVFHTGEETVIGCVFDDLPAEITLENVTTSFSKEYLINRDGNLEVLKKYPTNGKTTIWIYANHPSNDGFNDLLLKKNNELKAMIRAAHLEDGVNLSINSAMRAALWASLGDTITFEVREISADQADEKKLWPKIEPLLPSYRLFKADRPSSDEDQEAQDPMQHAMKTALEEQSEQLNAIANEVQRKVSEVATNTIQKLREFDPELAATLTPKFKKEPTWEKAFSFSLTGENSIPLNKRGSGIRRLVLFSFFRATTESALFEGKGRKFLRVYRQQYPQRFGGGQRCSGGTADQCGGAADSKSAFSLRCAGGSGDPDTGSHALFEGFRESAYHQRPAGVLGRIQAVCGADLRL